MSQGNEDRLLYEIKSRGPQPAAALAAALAITPMGAHKLLARLEEQGLVEAREEGPDPVTAALPPPAPARRARAQERPGTPAEAQASEPAKARVGRPRKLWSLTEAGHGRFPDRHGDLTVQLIQQARAIFGEAGLEQLIAARERDSEHRYRAALARCRTTGDAVKELARLRAEEGYMARAERVGRDWVLIEDHCPICAAAQSCQGFCRSELALFQRCLGPGLAVERTEHVLAGARRCAYRVSAVEADPA